METTPSKRDTPLFRWKNDPSNKMQHPEFVVAEFAKAIADVRAGKGSEDPSVVSQKLTKVYGETLSRGFYDEKKVDQRTTVKVIDSENYIVLHEGEELISCENGKDPSIHPDNLMLIADKESGTVTWAIVRSWEDGKVMFLNRAENYIITAISLLEKSEKTDTIEKAFDCLYQLSESRLKILAQHTPDEIAEYFECYYDEDDLPFTLGGMFIPTCLFFESRNNLLELAKSFPRKCSSVFDVTPKKQSVPKPRKASSSSSSSSSSSKGKKSSAHKKSSVISALNDADLLQQVSQIFQNSESIRGEYFEVFCERVLKPGPKEPKEHKVKKEDLKKVHRATASLYPDKVSTMTCAERMLSAMFQILGEGNEGIENQIASLVNHMEAKLETNTKYKFIAGPLGKHYNGSTEELVQIKNTRELYVVILLIANQIIPKTVETVELAFENKINSHCEEIAKIFQENYQKLLSSLENEVAEMSRTLESNQAQLNNYNKENNKIIQEMSDKLARANIKNAQLQARIDELEAAASSDALPSFKKRKAEEAGSSLLKKQKVKQSEIVSTLTKATAKQCSDDEDDGDILSGYDSD